MTWRVARFIMVEALFSIACDSYRSLGPTANPSKRDLPDSRGTTAVVFDNYYVVGLFDASVRGDSIVGIRPGPGQYRYSRLAMPLARVSIVETMQPDLIRQLLSAHFGRTPVNQPSGAIKLVAAR